MYVAMLKLVITLLMVQSLLHLRPHRPFPLREKFMYITKRNLHIDKIYYNITYYIYMQIYIYVDVIVVVKLFDNFY